MTAQFGDQFLYDGVCYNIVRIDEPLNFSPEAYGITPEAACTACWNGFWCRYNITDEGIFLEDLYIHSKDEVYPEINGVAPCTEGDGKPLTYFGHRLYKGLNLRIPYSGKILVGTEFLPKYYIHGGYQRPWAYNVLTEFILEKGVLAEKKDHSHLAAAMREQIDTPKEIYSKRLGKTVKVVNACFDFGSGKREWWM